MPPISNSVLNTSTLTLSQLIISFLTFNTYKYAFPLFPFYSFDNDDKKSSKRHAVLLSLIFLLKCFSKSFFIIFYFYFNYFTFISVSNRHSVFKGVRKS